jgi:long-chain acyl-CoA synthetase
MKLAQGEYVALEKIEDAYSRNHTVMQVFVHGNGLKSYLIGVIVPDPVQFAAFASRTLGHGVDAADTRALEEICRDPRIVDGLLQELNKGAGNLKGWVIFLGFDSGLANGAFVLFKIRTAQTYPLEP